MVKVGVIGLGFMGVTHLKAYQQVPSARLVAICDAVRLPADGNLASVAGNLASTSDLKLDMSVVNGYREYEALLANPEVDLVDICLPTPLHAPVAIAALKAGKHVICEKPLARTSATCREIVTAARNAKGFFMPAMCLRFWPEWAFAQKAIRDQTYGRVLAARFRRISAPPAWSQGSYFKGDESGGALLDLHIHDTDFVQFCFGRPLSVYSTGLTRFSGAVDHVVTQYKVTGDAVVSAEGTWIMTPGAPFNMAYTINCERATIDYDLARGNEALKVYEEGRETNVRLKAGDGYVGELSHMVESIEKQQAPSIVTGQDGLVSVEICEAEERSVKTGQIVSLS